jgi:tripeptide aminopeptidase
MSRLALVLYVALNLTQVQAEPVRNLVGSSRFRAAVAALRADHDHMIEQTIALTQIPAPPFAEDARAHAYADLMRDSGFAEVTADGIGNVIGIRAGSDRSLPPLVVAAHLDTVFPAGTNVNVRRAGTRLSAPGIGDDTRSLAVLLAFARAMDKATLCTRRDVMFVADVGEEGRGDLRGMRYLFEHNDAAKHAVGFISMDLPGAGWIVVQGVGSRRYHLVFDGPGGHSFDAFGIVNPLAALADTVVGLYHLQVTTDPKTTYAASVVGGGTSVNAIPSQVFLDVDLRSVNAKALSELDAKLHNLAADAVAQENTARGSPRGQVAVTFNLIGDRPAGATPQSAPIVTVAAEAARAFGYPVRFIPLSTDANVPMQLGIPAITIGSGASGSGEHAPDESIDVEINESVRGMSVGLATILAAAGVER